MDLMELLQSGGIGLAVLLSIIQIAPIEVKPWSAIARVIGKALNVSVMEKLDEHEAKAARYRIIRFDDEIRHDMRHSEEHFNQILDDIHEYEVFCQAHPNFPNGKAISAIDKIKKIYEKCKDEQSFL